jgi:hypothetical protein
MKQYNREAAQFVCPRPPQYIYHATVVGPDQKNHTTVNPYVWPLKAPPPSNSAHLATVIKTRLKTCARVNTAVESRGSYGDDDNGKYNRLGRGRC